MAGNWITVGKLVNTQGIRGEVKIMPQTHFPDVRFAAGSRLTLQDPASAAAVEVEVLSAREQKGMYILKLKNYDNINQVERYKGWTVVVPDTELVELEEGEYYYHDIIGCSVVTEDGETLGTVTDILSPGANDVWVVKRPNGKELLLPVIDDVLLRVEPSAKLITVRLLEGLI